MNEDLTRQRCYAFLLGEMEAADRMCFESALRDDVVLREELRNCELDLADFADAALPRREPSSSVWSGIVGEIHGSGEAEKSKKRFVYRAWMVWAAAAALLLVLNIWQFWNAAELDLGGEAKVAVSQRDTALSKELNRLQAELNRLEERIADLDRQRGEAVASDEANSAALERMEQERASLVQRIEYLETNFVALAEFANPLLKGDLDFVSGGLVNFVPFKAPVDGEEEDDTGSPGDVWLMMASLISEPGMVEIPFFPRGPAEFSSAGTRSSIEVSAFNAAGVVADSSSGALSNQESNTPFALAFANSETNQVFLSVGNLNLLPEQMENTLWVRDGEDSYFKLGELPVYGGNLAIRLPEGVEDSPEFLISIEEDSEAQSPSEIVVLETVGE